MPSSVHIQIESSDDLPLFVELHELDESLDSLKKLWQERAELIKVGPQSGDIVQIMKGWRTNISTYAVLNDGAAFIINDSEYDNSIILRVCTAARLLNCDELGDEVHTTYSKEVR